MGELQLIEASEEPKLKKGDLSIMVYTVRYLHNKGYLTVRFSSVYRHESVRIQVCTYIHMHTYTRTYTHTHTHTYIHMHTHTRTYTHAYTYTYIHTYTRTYTHAYIYIYIPPHICIHCLGVYVCTTCTQQYIHTKV